MAVHLSIRSTCGTRIISASCSIPSPQVRYDRPAHPSPRPHWSVTKRLGSVSHPSESSLPPLLWMERSLGKMDGLVRPPSSMLTEWKDWLFSLDLPNHRPRTSVPEHQPLLDWTNQSDYSFLRFLLFVDQQAREEAWVVPD